MSVLFFGDRFATRMLSVSTKKVLERKPQSMGFGMISTGGYFGRVVSSRAEKRD